METFWYQPIQLVLEIVPLNEFLLFLFKYITKKNLILLFKSQFECWYADDGDLTGARCK